jgi:hypothetical protein
VPGPLNRDVSWHEWPKRSGERFEGRDVAPLRFEVFGRRVLIERCADGWEVFDLGSEGKRRRAEGIFIPSDISEEELERYLADLCHEGATPRYPSVIRLP